MDFHSDRLRFAPVNGAQKIQKKTQCVFFNIKGKLESPLSAPGIPKLALTSIEFSSCHSSEGS
jgi:hypothetical protein